MAMRLTFFRAFFLPLLLVCALSPGMAHAEVLLTFYAREMGESFPHAFVKVEGTLEAGQKVDADYGFTAVNVSPAILMGSVKGHVAPLKPAYIAKSTPHFHVRLNDAQYADLMATVRKWRELPQKSYSLNKRNCVHFVADLARTVGLAVKADSRFYKKPTSFLQEVQDLNRTRLASAQ